MTYKANIVLKDQTIIEFEKDFIYEVLEELKSRVGHQISFSEIETILTQRYEKVK
jgi:hypothetical protein